MTSRVHAVPVSGGIRGRGRGRIVSYHCCSIITSPRARGEWAVGTGHYRRQASPPNEAGCGVAEGKARYFRSCGQLMAKSWPRAETPIPVRGALQVTLATARTAYGHMAYGIWHMAYRNAIASDNLRHCWSTRW